MTNSSNNTIALGSESEVSFKESSNGSVKEFAKGLEQLLAGRTRPLKLIIHAGTPKTGTTSLQVYLDKKQRKLRSKGILYPNRSHNPNAPKHQWFERNLVSAHAQHLLENFKNIFADIEEHTHTILLSSEGIYNHWWDFPDESKALLLEIAKLFEFKLWVWFRQPLEFAESFYKQCLRNPAIDTIACYGKNLSFAEILADPWFNQHLDYMGFVEDCDALFGKNAISVFEYEHDTVKTASQLLGLATPHDNPTPRKNHSMNGITAEIFRVINRYSLSAKEKEKLIPQLQELNAELMPFANRESESLIDEESRAKINEMTAKGMLEIQKRYLSIINDTPPTFG